MKLPERANTEAATVLVVDDDQQLRGFCEKCLSRNGFRVLQGDDGLEALLIAASHGGSIDILITDIELPRIRGTELGQVFKLLWPHTRVLYVSGSSQASSHLDLESGGTFLPKPFPPEILVKTVGQILSSR
jgi:DNA-binding response OmpR family regulator